MKRVREAIELYLNEEPNSPIPLELVGMQQISA